LAFPPDLPKGRLSAVVFHVVREGLDPLGTTGSLKAGGRCNAPNEFGALYTSLDAATATKEVARGLRQRGVDPKEFPTGAWWIYELEVKIETVLDLTDSDVLQKAGTERDALTGGEVHATREIAAEARRCGYQALLVPSAADPELKNLVVFLDKLPSPPTVLSSRTVNFQEESL
jgi:RES domain-containing protein